MKLPKQARDALRQMDGWRVISVWNTQVTVEHDDASETFTFYANDRIANTLAGAEKLVPGSTQKRAPKKNRRKSVKAREREDAARIEAQRLKFAQQRAAELSREEAARRVTARERELSHIRRLMSPGGQ